MKKSVFLLLSVMLAACASRSPSPSFYTLPTRGDADVVSRDVVSVDVARVRIPEYIDRPQMVMVSDVNVDVNPDNRWVEGLSPMIQRRLIANMVAHLPRATITDGALASAHGDYAVLVDISRLDGELGGDSVMDAVYVITCDGTPHVTRRAHYTHAAGDDYAAYAAAVGAMVDSLAHDVARAVADIK